MAYQAKGYGYISLLETPSLGGSACGRQAVYFCLYKIGLYELGIDPADVLPPMKPARKADPFGVAGLARGGASGPAPTQSPSRAVPIRGNDLLAG